MELVATRGLRDEASPDLEMLSIKTRELGAIIFIQLCYDIARD